MRRILMLVTAAVLAGCVTRYGPAGISGGYSESMRADDVYVVRFEGNAYTKAGQAEDMAMLRAAELALSKGFSYFTVLDESTRIDTTTMTMPGQATTRGNLDSYGRFRAYTTTAPGYTIPLNSPTARILVGFARDNNLRGYSWINAAKFIAETGPRYDFKPAEMNSPGAAQPCLLSTSGQCLNKTR